ncbi:MAG: Nif3-like dinuclear metal center hexameric protein, partial [Calditrichaceae bacterium]
SKINEDLIVFAFGPDKIKNVGVISGGAQKEVKQAVLDGLDLYLTGEVSEHILHYVKEEGIHFVAAGHHATERFGIQTLGDHLKKHFDVNVEYIEIPNPI